MSELPDNSVDLVCTDPPYNVGKKEHGWTDDGFDVDVVFKELFRILKDNTRAYIFCANSQIFSHRKRAKKVGFKFHQMLIWHRRNLVGGTMKSGWDWKSTYEPILLFHKGKPPKLHQLEDGRDGFDVRIEASPQSNFIQDKRVHITQKPFRLISDIIERSSNPGDIVLDPFLGSGTTAVAAKTLGRNYIGIEKELEYAQIAISRVAAARKEDEQQALAV